MTSYCPKIHFVSFRIFLRLPNCVFKVSWLKLCVHFSIGRPSDLSIDWTSDHVSRWQSEHCRTPPEDLLSRLNDVGMLLHVAAFTAPETTVSGFCELCGLPCWGDVPVVTHRLPSSGMMEDSGQEVHSVYTHPKPRLTPSLSNPPSEIFKNICLSIAVLCLAITCTTLQLMDGLVSCLLQYREVPLGFRRNSFRCSAHKSLGRAGCWLVDVCVSASLLTVILTDWLILRAQSPTTQ